MKRANEALQVCLSALLLLAFSNGCSVRKIAINKLGDAISGDSTTFASDNDPELIRSAVPFSLKLIESLLAESPRHRGLLLAAAKGFTQYSYAFIQQDGDEMEERDLATADVLRHRARNLYMRARDYGMRGLELTHPDFTAALRRDAKSAVTSCRQADVPFLYWTAAAWGAAVALSKDDPETVADVPIVQALIDRALELDEKFDLGAIHTFLISYESSRAEGKAEAANRARRHFERAVELSGGRLAGPFVALAESVSVSAQNRAEFQSLLTQALAIDPNARPEWRLANLVMQRRARWLLARVNQFFVE
ncbi:MAG TPA: TRAP transporter TatT component family protein [Acidobacteriota bacterium]